MKQHRFNSWALLMVMATAIVAGLTWNRSEGPALGQAAGGKQPGKKKALDDGRDADRQAILQSSKAFADAFDKGDAKEVASFWTEDGEYINDDGTVIKGRAAIEKSYAAFFAKYPKQKVTVEIDSVRFPSKRTAIEEGHLRVQKTKGGEISTSRYSVLHVKEGDAWEMAIVREWPDEGVTLRDIDWLIGTWTANAKETEVRTTYRWNEEKTFILMDYSIQEKGQQTRKGTSTIARDPATEQLRSWQFEAEGGFGETAWTRDGKKWVLEANGTLPSGSKVSALNVITPLGPDSFIWQSTQRQLDGEDLPDLPPVKVNRVKTSK